MEVENSGSVPGTETVQFYLQDVVAKIARPVRELKEYKKVSLQPGEKATVSAVLPFDTIGYYDEALTYTVEPGEFRLFVGHDSTAELSVSVFLEENRKK